MNSGLCNASVFGRQLPVGSTPNPAEGPALAANHCAFADLAHVACIYPDPVRRAGNSCCVLHGLYHRGISTNHELVGLVRAGGPTRNRQINCTCTLRVCDNSMGPGALAGETGRLLKPATMAEDSHTITHLLLDWRSGNKDATARLMELVYHELHEIGSRQMHLERGETHCRPQPCSMRLTSACVARRRSGFMTGRIFSRSRPNSYVVVLVDYARRFYSERRGGGKVCATLSDADNAVWSLHERLLAVDGTLRNLETLDRRAAKVIERRFLGGLTETEVAEALEIFGYYIETGLRLRAKLAGSSARMTSSSKPYALPERHLREVLAKR